MRLVNIYVLKRTGELRVGAKNHTTQHDADLGWYDMMDKKDCHVSRLCTIPETESYGIPQLNSVDGEKAAYVKWMRELEAEANGQNTLNNAHGDGAGDSKQLLEHVNNSAAS